MNPTGTYNRNTTDGMVHKNDDAESKFERFVVWLQITCNCTRSIYLLQLIFVQIHFGMDSILHAAIRSFTHRFKNLKHIFWILCVKNAICFHVCCHSGL